MHLFSRIYFVTKPLKYVNISADFDALYLHQTKRMNNTGNTKQYNFKELSLNLLYNKHTFMKNHIRVNKVQTKINKSTITEIKTKTGEIKIWSEKQYINDDETKVMVKLLKLKHVYKHLAALPDFHIGGLLMNGLVIPTTDYIYINAVGGDIGCGMSSLSLPLNQDDILGKEQELYKALYSTIPTGRRTNTSINEYVEKNAVFKNDSELLTKKVIKKLKQQLGTIGDGNHFLEIQKNKSGQLHLLVHTGSRYLGQLIKEYYIKNISDMQNNKLYAVKADSEIGKDFLNDHDLAVQYAKENRNQITRVALKTIKEVLKLDFNIENLLEERLDIPHNYISVEYFDNKKLYIHRKGAQKAEKGDMGIIPGDMGNNTYLVEGKGYPLTFNSCSHGAGRKIARGRALNTIDYNKFLTSVDGIVCRKDRNVLDEAPQAYKDIEQVIKYQKEIIKILDIFNPVINIKG